VVTLRKSKFILSIIISWSTSLLMLVRSN